jgi:plastocyanin
MAKLRMRTTAVRSAASRLGSLLAALGAAAPCAAGVLEVSVVDDDGRPIENVAVYATRADAAAEHGATAAAAESSGPAPTAIMDQHDYEFVPHMLVVQAGTSVTFPNSDDVSHHVYSFSEAKTFELALYKGDVYPPVVFDRPGVVVVGCNIHDGMLGYIRVVDTPHFAVTNERGVAVIAGVPSGAYVVEAWTPRARPDGLPEPMSLGVAGATTAAELTVTGRLSPPHAHGASSLKWDRY